MSTPKWQLTTTENNATSYTTTGNGRIDLFFKTVRNVRADNLLPLLNTAWEEDHKDTTKIIFNARDCRGGKGERDIFLMSMQWLATKDIDLTKRSIVLIPEYGRWDEVVKLTIVPELEDTCMGVLRDQLVKDLEGLESGKSISLLAKWLPTEGSKLDRQLGFVKKFCALLGIDKKAYRKTYLTPLREHLRIVENLMVHKRWDEIKFPEVPSLAMKRYRKAFAKQSPEKFEEFLTSLQKGEVEIKAKQLFPHEIVDEYFKNAIRNTMVDVDLVLEEQWKVISAETQSLGEFDKAIWLADMSGSMSGTPMLVAATLSLLCSPFSQAPYTNKVMTFSDNPVFCTVEGETLRDRVYDMYNKMSPGNMWGGSTNLQAVFNLILNTAVEHNLPAELMPTSIYIISDMQFNQAFPGVSNDEAIRIKYAQSGYECPKIIYWNVRANTLDFPIGPLQNINTALISGFSPAVLKAVLRAKEFTPLTIVLDTINDPRYDKVEQLFTTDDDYE